MRAIAVAISSVIFRIDEALQCFSAFSDVGSLEVEGLETGLPFLFRTSWLI